MLRSGNLCCITVEGDQMEILSTVENNYWRTTHEIVVFLLFLLKMFVLLTSHLTFWTHIQMHSKITLVIWDDSQKEVTESKMFHVGKITLSCGLSCFSCVTKSPTRCIDCFHKYTCCSIGGTVLWDVLRCKWCTSISLTGIPFIFDWQTMTPLQMSEFFRTSDWWPNRDLQL